MSNYETKNQNQTIEMARVTINEQEAGAIQAQLAGELNMPASSLVVSQEAHLSTPEDPRTQEALAGMKAIGASLTSSDPRYNQMLLLGYGEEQAKGKLDALVFAGHSGMTPARLTELKGQMTQDVNSILEQVGSPFSL